MPVLNETSSSFLNTSIKKALNGNIPKERLQDEIKRLLPDGTSFVLNGDGYSDLDSAGKLNIIRENFNKFKETAPEYEPSPEDISTFKSNIEALESATPAQSAPRATTANREAPATEAPSSREPVHEEPERQGNTQADFEREERLKYLEENSPDFYNFLKTQPREQWDTLMEAHERATRSNELNRRGVGRLDPRQDERNFNGAKTKPAPYRIQKRLAKEASQRDQRIRDNYDREKAERDDAMQANAIFRENAHRRVNNGLTNASSEFSTEFAKQKSNIESYNKECEVKIPGLNSMSKEDQINAVNDLMARDQRFKALHNSVGQGYTKLAGITNRAQGHIREAKQQGFRDLNGDIDSFSKLSGKELPDPKVQTPDIEKEKSVFDRVAEGLRTFVESVISVVRGRRDPESRAEAPSRSPAASTPSGPGM